MRERERERERDRDRDRETERQRDRETERERERQRETERDRDRDRDRQRQTETDRDRDRERRREREREAGIGVLLHFRANVSAAVSKPVLMSLWNMGRAKPFNLPSPFIDLRSFFKVRETAESYSSCFGILQPSSLAVHRTTSAAED